MTPMQEPMVAGPMLLPLTGSLTQSKVPQRTLFFAEDKNSPSLMRHFDYHIFSIWTDLPEQ